MVIKIAKRRAYGAKPENTLDSFKKVLELGVDMIEFDVYKCKTGELVIIHRESEGIALKGRKLIENSVFNDINTMFGLNNEKIPELGEVLDLINRKVKVNIELKCFNMAADVALVIHSKMKNNGWTYDDFIISSFLHQELVDLKKIDDQLNRGVFISSLPADLTEILPIEPFSIELPGEFVTEEFIENVHSNGIKLFVWSIDDKEQLNEMEALGVDGVFINYPERPTK